MMSLKPAFSVLLLLSAAATAPADDLTPVPGTLARYVPADVWMATASISTPEHAFVCAHWDRVKKALSVCGIDREIRAGILASLPEAQRPEFEKTWDTLLDAIRSVNWTDLTGNELLVAERFTGIFPDVFLVLRPEPATLDQNVAGLARTLKTLASFDKDGDITFSDYEERGVKVWALEIKDAPVGLYVLHQGPIVELVAGRPGRDDALALLCGNGKTKSLLDNPRFRRALGEVPPPQHQYAFLDLHSLFSVLPMLPKMIAGQQALEARQRREAAAASGNAVGEVQEDTSEVDAWLGLFAAIMDNVDVVDYIVTSSRMEGTQEYSYSVTRSLASARDKPVYRMLANRRPIESIEKYIPAEANSFGAYSTLDVGILYDLILSLIRDHAPGGAAVCDKWEQLQQAWDFNLREDVFSWLSGELIKIELPARTPTPFGNAAGVTMIRVHDPQKAQAKVEAGLNRLAGFMQSRGQSLELVSAESATTAGFKRIETGMFMAFMMKPCIGVWEDWLVFGTSDHAIRTVIDTATGRHDNILKNKRFRADGLTPEGPVVGATFADLSRVGEQLTAFFIGMGFAAGSMPDQPELRPIRTMIRSLGSLGPVVNEINFFSSMSSVTTFADGVWHTTTKLTYKDSAPPAAAAD
ncbi:MAG TPA: DUF3352 domain-containing protein [Phycisphaerae bacterium]|nr:DUF3352 domain-containing protein [Phycisphaerae bacterium]